MTDLSNWLTNEQAAAQLGVSIRTLDRMAKDLSPRPRPIPGRRPERVFDPEVIRQRMQPEHAVAVSPAANGLATIPPQTAGLTQPSPPEITWPNIIAVLEEFAQNFQPHEPALWVRLDEAAQITGLSRAALRRLVKSGDLKAIRDAAIKVRRAGLEDLDVSSLLVAPAKVVKRKARR